MVVQIIITGIIAFAAVYILYKNIKKKSSGGCHCDSCSSHCPSYKKGE